MHTRRTFGDIVAGLPVAKAAIAGVLAIAPLLLPDRLIPAQVDALRTIAPLAVLIAVFVGWVYLRRLEKSRGIFIALAGLALLAVTVVQLLYVETFVGIGDPPQTEYHLIGYAISPEGQTMLRQAGLENAPRHVALGAMGPSAIPALYGSSYSVIVMIYAVTALLLVFSLGVILTMVEQGGSPPPATPPSALSRDATAALLLLLCSASPVTGQSPQQRAWLDSARTLDSVAIAAYQTGVRSRQLPALALLHRAERLWLKGGDSIKAARDHGRLGVVFDAVEMQDSALAYYSETITRQQRLRDSVGLGRTTFNRGNVFLQRGEFGAAVADYRSALAAARAGHDTSDAVYALYQLGWAFHSQRRKTASSLQDDSASYYYHQVLREAPAAGETGLLAMGHERLGSLFEDRSQPDSALAHYQEALQLLRTKVNDSTRLAFALFGIGSVYASLNRAEPALANLRESSRISALMEDEAGRLKTDLKIAAVQAQQLNDAIAAGNGDSVMRAWQAEHVLDSMSLLTRRFVESVGRDSLPAGAFQADRVRQLQGMLGKDPGLAQAMLTLEFARMFPTRQTLGQAFRYIANVFMERDSARLALVYLDSALTAFRDARDQFGEVDARTDMAWVHHRIRGDLPAALAQYDTAAAVRAGTAAQSGADPNRVSLHEQDVDLFSGWALATLSRMPGDAGARAALRVVEQGRAQALLALLGADTALVPGGPHDAETARLLQGGAGVARVVYWLAEDTLLTWAIDASGGVTLSRRNLLRASLAHDLAKTSAKLRTMGRRNAGRDSLAQLVEAYRAAVRETGPATRSSLDVAGRAIAALTLPPEILQRLPASGELVIVPFGPLGVMPFAALPLSNGRLLGERFAIAYAPSLKVFNVLLTRRTSAAAGDPSTPLIIGNPHNSSVPDVATGGLKLLRQLPNADSLARWLGNRLHAQPLIGDAATEGVVKARIGAADLVDFGTHGLAYGGAELVRKSFVALTPDSTNDGMLTVAELLDSLPPLHARLVVLGACETGLGDLRRAEGVVGLARAVIARGADGVLITLWDVNDQVTSELLRAFYDQWLAPNHRSKAEALRLAQDLVRRTHPDPRHWAAFQFVGH